MPRQIDRSWRKLLRQLGMRGAGEAQNLELSDVLVPTIDADRRDPPNGYGFKAVQLAVVGNRALVEVGVPAGVVLVNPRVNGQAVAPQPFEAVTVFTTNLIPVVPTPPISLIASLGGPQQSVSLCSFFPAFGVGPFVPSSGAVGSEVIFGAPTIAWPAWYALPDIAGPTRVIFGSTAVNTTLSLSFWWTEFRTHDAEAWREV